MKPILFNTEMVRAILVGRKTVTRRVVKPQPFAVKQDENAPCWYGHFVSESGKVLLDKPPYQPGDILYVREAWTQDGDVYRYKAGFYDQNRKWRPSIHMPREAARIFLRVTGVRVERLQDINDDEALKEGFGYFGAVDWIKSPFYDFRDTWDTLLKPKDRALCGWQANPWVWVIEFEKVSRKEALSCPPTT